MLWWLLQNAVVTAILAGMVALLCRRFQFRPAIRHALWLVVAIKLLTPSFIQWPWPAPAPWQGVPCWTSARQASPAPEEPVAALPMALSETRVVMLQARIAFLQSVKDGADVELLPPPAEFVGVEAESEAVAFESATPAAAEPAPIWPEWPATMLLATWLIGAVAIGGVQLVRIVRFARLARFSQPAPGWLQERLHEAAARLGVRPPRLGVVPGIGSPQIWSLGRPVLLWPGELLEELPADRVPGVLLHELAHIRRRDHWVSWLLLVAACVWWWNPLFWYVRRQLRLNAELACDAWVIWLLPDCRRTYAEALIEVTEFVSLRTAPLPALGMSGGKQDFQRRLTMIMRERVPCQIPTVALLGIGLLALLALPGWSLGQKEEREKTPPPDNVKEIKSGDDVIYYKIETDGPDSDKHLQELEKKIQQMLEEIKALRTKGAKTTEKKPTPTPTETKKPVPPVPPTMPTPPPHGKVVVLPGGEKIVINKDELLANWIRKEKGSQTTVLSRSTYKLPKEKAEALAGFLKEHVKAEVLELKLEGDTLTVTTTPDAQKTIGDFIALILGKTASSGKFTIPMTIEKPK